MYKTKNKGFLIFQQKILVSDIGANLKDAMYEGFYSSKNQKHEPDIDHVLNRAWNAGLEKIIITGTNVEDSISSLKLAQSDGMSPPQEKGLASYLGNLLEEEKKKSQPSNFQL